MPGKHPLASYQRQTDKVYAICAAAFTHPQSLYQHISLTHSLELASFKAQFPQRYKARPTYSSDDYRKIKSLELLLAKRKPAESQTYMNAGLPSLRFTPLTP
ncbi:Hypothetical protein FKW44_024049 [Caligus rogercresseyi]|uniref:Uncharacterized protein n=1 Tax=Caligus rogercresseyi TaxID=217165 RepID=A0A7T8JUK4_CALRO|nr:Hypothetical protein FKW44_024049 [Caligus rogercresseyi]